MYKILQIRVERKESVVASTLLRGYTHLFVGASCKTLTIKRNISAVAIETLFRYTLLITPFIAFSFDE